MPHPYPAARTVLAPPMLAREVTDLPRGEDWMYEFIWSGERVRAVKREGAVHLLSRDGRDFTNRFPRIAAAVARLRSHHVIIDGEILYLDSCAASAARFLADTVDEPSGGGLVMVAYDLLCDDGRDIRQFPLLCRRLLLASTVQGTPIALAPLIADRSEVALAASSRMGFRGVVAKRAGSAYRPNALAADWVKMTFAPRTAAGTPGVRPTSSLPGGDHFATLLSAMPAAS